MRKVVPRPNRSVPEPDAPLTPDAIELIHQRLATFDEDRQQAADWEEVKARILQQKRPH